MNNLIALHELFVSTLYRPNPAAWPLLFTACAVAGLGIYVFLREKHSSVRNSFLLLTLSGAAWLGFFGAMLCSLSEHVALFWAKTAYLAVPFIPSCLYLFTVKVLRIYESRRRIVMAGFAGSLSFSGALILSDALFDGVHLYPWGYYPHYTAYSALYLLFFLGLMAASLREFVSEIRKTPNPTHRSRVRWLLLAFSIASLAAVDYLPKFGIGVYPVGCAFILGFVAIAAHTVTRYRLIDITSSFAADKIIGTMGDALLVLDNEDVVRIANDEAARLFGTTKEKLTGAHLTDLSPHFSKRDQPGDAHRTGTEHAYRIDHLSEEGRSLTLQVSESSMKDSLGCVVATVLIVRDVTELEAVRRALAESETRLSGLYKELSEALIILDEYGRFVSLNPAAERLLGTTETRIAGRIFVMSNYVPSRHMSSVMKSLRNVIEAERQESFEIEISDETGRTKLVRVTALPIRREGKISAVQLLLVPVKGVSDEQTLEEARHEVETRVRRVLEETFRGDSELIRKFQKLQF